MVTAVQGRRRTPDGEGRRTEAFLRLRPPQGRKRTADRQLFVSSGQRRTLDGGVRPPQERIQTADAKTFPKRTEADGFGRRTDKFSFEADAGRGSSSASRTDSDGGQAQFLKKADGGRRRTKADEVRTASPDRYLIL